MRINEVAGAEEQLALWKLISDNTWAAVSQQAEAERRQRAARAAQRKLKPKIGGRRGVRKSLPPPPPHIAPPPKKQPPPQTKTQVGKEPAQQMGVGMKQPQATAANPQQPNAVPSQQQALGMTQQKSNITNPQAAHLQQLQGSQQPLTQQQTGLQRQNTGNL